MKTKKIKINGKLTLCRELKRKEFRIIRDVYGDGEKWETTQCRKQGSHARQAYRPLNLPPVGFGDDELNKQLARSKPGAAPKQVKAWAYADKFHEFKASGSQSALNSFRKKPYQNSAGNPKIVRVLITEITKGKK